MIRPGITVRTMTGKTGTVLAIGVPTSSGRHAPERRVQIALNPFVDRTDGRELPAIKAIYHADDLEAIGQE